MGQGIGEWQVAQGQKLLLDEDIARNGLLEQSGVEPTEPPNVLSVSNRSRHGNPGEIPIDLIHRHRENPGERGAAEVSRAVHTRQVRVHMHHLLGVALRLVVVKHDHPAIELLEKVKLAAAHVGNESEVVPLFSELGQQLPVKTAAEGYVEFLPLPQEGLRKDCGSGGSVRVVVTKDPRPPRLLKELHASLNPVKDFGGNEAR